jgi:triosephosphate isomerase (TIM)
MRKKIVAGNWKMNKTHQEGLSLLFEIVRQIKSEEILIEDSGKYLPQIIVAPPYTLLSDASSFVQALGMKVAAQNCCHEESGAFTGEISARMLKAIEVNAVIVGHSERRALLGETNAIISKKIDRALAHSLQVICCIGETLEQREAGKEFQTVTHQLEECLFHVPPTQLKNVILAYEPVWAIGTGKNATAEQAQEIHHYIRSVISGKFGKLVADAISILYGGSCNPTNAKKLFSCLDVDGGLIGGASLVANDFMEIVKSAVE